MATSRFLVITAARNEAAYIGQTIDSLVSQTLVPQEWVMVDDGSTDETLEIITKAAQEHPWIKPIRLEDRGYRDMSGTQVQVIYEGLKHSTCPDYEFLFNIDADRVLPPGYFQGILDKFQENPRLGIAGGEVYDNFQGALIKMRFLPEISNGGSKCWRRQCFEEIGGLVQGLGWDGIDCFKAMMLGWQTQTFPDENLRVIHLRPEGSSDRNRFRGWIRRGQALHFSGTHPLWLMASALYHVVDPPLVLGSLCMVFGYVRALVLGKERYGDQNFRRFLHNWQLKKLTRILTGA